MCSETASECRLVVTGGHGFVAGSVIAQAPADWQVEVFSRGEALHRAPNLRWSVFDTLDPKLLAEHMKRAAPTAVIHAAAIADIDYCEANREEARRVNTVWTEQVAACCAEAGARLIFISTDNVFDGKNGPYTEESSTEPVNYYGQTKLEAEQAASYIVRNHAVARLALVMGLPILGSGNSFLSRMIPKLEAGEEVGVPVNEVRSPIDVITAGRALLELAGRPFRRVIHLGGEDGLPRLDIVRRIAARLGYPDAQIVPNDPSNIPGRADRPREVVFNNALARQTLDTPMLGLEKAVDLVMTETPKLAAKP